MSKKRVLLAGPGRQQFATIETEATIGAVLGRNLLDEDGNIVSLEDLMPAQPDDREIQSLIVTVDREAAAAIADNRKLMLMGF